MPVVRPCCFCTVKSKMSAVCVVINWLTISVMFMLQRVNGSLRKATMIYYFPHVVFILVPICVSLCFVGESWLQMRIRLNPLNCRQFLGVFLCSHHIFTECGVIFTQYKVLHLYGKNPNAFCAVWNGYSAINH